MKYRVLRDGVSQRPAPGAPTVPRAVDELIELTPESSAYMVAEGWVEPVTDTPSKTTSRQSRTAGD